MIIRSHISSTIKRKKFFRGFFLAGFAIVALVIGSLLTPLPLLHQFGLILPIGTIALVSVAMREYNFLRKREKNPFLLCFSKEALVLTTKGKAYFLLPCALIENIKFVQTHKEYGLAIWLSVPWQEHLFLKRDSTMLKKLHKKGKEYAADLFLPFFTKEGSLQIKRVLSAKPSLNNVMHTDDSHNL